MERARVWRGELFSGGRKVVVLGDGDEVVHLCVGCCGLVVQ